MVKRHNFFIDFVVLLTSINLIRFLQGFMEPSFTDSSSVLKVGVEALYIVIIVFIVMFIRRDIDD